MNIVVLCGLAATITDLVVFSLPSGIGMVLSRGRTAQCTAPAALSAQCAALH